MMQQTLILHIIILLSCIMDILKHKVVLQSLAKGKNMRIEANKIGSLVKTVIFHICLWKFMVDVLSPLCESHYGCPYSVLMVSRLRNRLIATHIL